MISIAISLLNLFLFLLLINSIIGLFVYFGYVWPKSRLIFDERYDDDQVCDMIYALESEDIDDGKKFVGGVDIWVARKHLTKAGQRTYTAASWLFMFEVVTTWWDFPTSKPTFDVFMKWVFSKIRQMN